MDDARELGIMLGKVQAQAESAEKSRVIMYAKIDGLHTTLIETLAAVRAIQSEQRDAKSKLESEVIPHIEDYRQMKNRGIGIFIGLATISGGIGAYIQKAVAWFGR